MQSLLCPVAVSPNQPGQSRLGLLQARLERPPEAALEDGGRRGRGRGQDAGRQVRRGLTWAKMALDLILFSFLSWVGVGWRPRGTQQSCQNFPQLGRLTDEEGDGYAEGEAEAEDSKAEGEAEGEKLRFLLLMSMMLFLLWLQLLLFFCCCCSCSS